MSSQSSMSSNAFSMQYPAIGAKRTQSNASATSINLGPAASTASSISAAGYPAVGAGSDANSGSMSGAALDAAQYPAIGGVKAVTTHVTSVSYSIGSSAGYAGLHTAGLSGAAQGAAAAGASGGSLYGLGAMGAVPQTAGESAAYPDVSAKLEHWSSSRTRDNQLEEAPLLTQLGSDQMCYNPANMAPLSPKSAAISDVLRASTMFKKDLKVGLRGLARNQTQLQAHIQQNEDCIRSMAQLGGPDAAARITEIGYKNSQLRDELYSLEKRKVRAVVMCLPCVLHVDAVVCATFCVACVE